MRTAMSIDPQMLEELVEATGARSRSAALSEAAAEYLRRKKLNETEGSMVGYADCRRQT